MYVILFRCFLAFDPDSSSFLCQFKSEIAIDYNLTIDLCYGIVYHTTLLDAIGCWYTATEYLSDAFNTIVNPSLAETCKLRCPSSHSAVNEETQFLACHHCNRLLYQIVDIHIFDFILS